MSLHTSFRSPLALAAAWSLCGAVCMPTMRGGDPDLAGIILPKGFSISVYADSVTNARAMCWGARGTLFVGSKEEGVVHALRDDDGDGRAEKHWTVDRNLQMPVGVAFHDGDLYVSAVSSILRYPDIEAHLEAPPEPVVVTDAFPSETHHGWKFIAFGPDGKLYVPVGAPCNNCLSDDPIYASISRINADGTGPEIVANGVRNTVGFDWHPTTGELWFTENGRDWLGDDTPDCELDRVTTIGQHFGYPFCHAGTIPDPEFGKQRACSDFVAPVAELGPHVAPLGMRFYTGSMFPEEYHNAIFIAEHGSWNRSTPIGYRIAVAYPQPDGTARTEVFAEGWLKGARAWGRPVDVLVAPDGSLLVSDDAADMIYRITYSGQ
ncbi:MAG: sorbosone dehydrogenase family protein [Flavobacteriales bacterium]|jgi:glucose/arabinose dehydrogenase|nr:sorbosone dehydrogenase family protein [Flavobacteriales bacterium]MBK6752447.1 sorbosone dehydrogenase family protein [Flavobacteriales bacterium]MBK7084792.1 sorbosone dehydrogenase family protein [Flavobacteriales bacterium]MBK7268789.1 sorbosone dehydrogenase family protein [Flavobacteriales bacterium]MBK7752105.1 sorbosone dehydrogenase family protein [Flavobacteriales bacterium]